jgi:hypothetical protein
LRDRISALELKLAGLTGAIDILRGLRHHRQLSSRQFAFGGQTRSIMRAPSSPSPAAPGRRSATPGRRRGRRIGSPSPSPVATGGRRGCAGPTAPTRPTRLSASSCASRRRSSRRVTIQDRVLAMAGK